LAVLFPIYYYRFPNLTNRQAIWALCGMFVGGFCWAEAATLGYRYTNDVKAIAAVMLIGGILGWLAAKVLRAERN
jgi:threonine/homoserine/homoserine lactone efflux protein